ncbi:MAG: thioredoxin family protein [Desulfobulbaceae bacterium]|nr:thioredoxin family protein [Desulfobulbaceae bacterium]
MHIMIAGPGCGRCQATEKVVREVVKDLGLVAAVEHVYDVSAYAKLGVMLTPAILVDGKIVFAGRVPTREELQQVIPEAG